MSLKRLVGVTMLISAIGLNGQSAFGQATAGTISGTVRDTTGGVLPGVTVTIKNLDTGVTRTLISDDQGRYRAANLTLGAYQVQGTLVGFQTQVRSGVGLTLGSEAVVDLTLRLGEFEEKLVVTGEATLVQTTDATVRHLVDQTSMREMPLNGRDFAQLATLQAGVYHVPSAGLGGHVSRVSNISVAGAQMASNRFHMDGVDINDRFNQTPGGVAGVLLGVEAVREFTILTSNFSAEYGAAGGAVVNIASRSGTNDLHGSVFEFHRNDALDARNFFDRQKPEFKRNQFGFAVGGPVAKDRTFFFGNYEGLREQLSRTSISFVPDENARRGFLPDARTGQLVFVGPVSPVIRPVLDLYPLPNGRSVGNGLAELASVGKQPLREDFFVVKIDHSFSASHSFFTRYTFDDGKFVDPFGGSVVSGFSLKRINRNQYVTVETTDIISPNTVNVLRFGFTRANPENFGTEKHAPLILFPGRQNAVIGIGGGVSSIGDSSVTPSRVLLNGFNVYDDVSYSRGLHSLKFGANVKRRQTNMNIDFRFAGNYSWATLQDFLLNLPARTFTGVAPGALNRRYFRTTLLSLYAQDDIRVNSRLTLNLGARYELLGNPTEKFGRISFIEDIATATDVSTDKHMFRRNPGLFNLAPRLGFAWDPMGSGKTAVRGGFGIFHTHLDGPELADSHISAPFTASARVFDPVYPQTLAGGFTAEFETRGVQRDMSTPYMMRWTLNIQHEILPSTVASIGYTGSRGVKLPYAVDLNPFVPTAFVSPGIPFYQPGIRPQRRNPRFGDNRSREGGAQSFFHGVDLSVKRRLSSGFQFSTAYSLGKAIDEASGAVGADFPNSRFQIDNPFSRRYSRGPANFDMRHKFNVTFLYELPFGPGRAFATDGNPLASSLLGGWDLSGIVTVSSGNPVTVTAAGDIARGVTVLSHARPDLKAGASNNPTSPGNPDGYVDRSAFIAPPEGQVGNLGANTVYAPGILSVDFSVLKKVPITEAVTLQFRTEIFNSFNRANFGVPNRSAFTRRGTVIVPSAAFGRITDTTTTARQVQFALKVIF